MELTEAIAVFDKSAERTRPNTQTEAWKVIRATLTAAGAAPGGWQAALVNEWESAAKDLRKDGLYRCCAGTYEHCAAHLKAGAQHGQEGQP